MFCVVKNSSIVQLLSYVIFFWGGIKLGTGGMARAYALAVKEVVKVSRLIPYEKQLEYKFDTSYAEVDKTLYHLKQLGISHYERDFGMHSVTWILLASEEQIQKFQNL